MNRSSTTATSVERITAPPAGWTNFVETHWEQRPLYLSNPFPTPFADRDWVFRVVVKASESAREAAPSQSSQKKYLRFCLEHTLPIAGLSDYLPRADDESLDSYVGRMNDFLDHRDFTLITNNAQGYDFELWNRMRAFVSGLYDIIGTPLRSEVVIYLSKSRTTAAGVHRDPYSNFLFQIYGRKRFHLWPSELIRARPQLARAVNYEEILDEAQTFDLAAGDFLYIPSDYYHLAEADDGLSVHVSIIVGTERETGSQLTLNMASQLVKERLGAWNDNPFVKVAQQTGTETFQLPSSLQTVVGAFNNLEQRLNESLASELIRLSTALGCELAPPLLESPAALVDDDIVEADAQSPIIYQVSKNSLYFAANGHGFGCPAHPHALGLIRLLSSGGSHRVGELLNDFSGAVVLDGREVRLRSEDVRRLLEMLHLIRALKKRESGEQPDSSTTRENAGGREQPSLQEAT